MTALTISNIPVRQDLLGRFCLNDLHKAAGGEEKHSPNRFTRSDNYQSLIDELTPDLAFDPVESIRGGSNPGTYGCKEIVYSYAMWISAKFHITVIRAYDALVSKPAIESSTLNKAQQGELFTRAKQIAGESGKIRAAIWSRFQNHFHLASYKDLPAEKYEEALVYLDKLRDEYGKGVEMLYISTADLEARIQQEADKRLPQVTEQNVYYRRSCEALKNIRAAAGIVSDAKARDRIAQEADILEKGLVNAWTHFDESTMRLKMVLGFQERWMRN